MPPGSRKPKRGDIWHLDFTPASGTEMLYKHFGLILSANSFNAEIHRVYIAPISTNSSIARDTGFQVNLTGAGTKTTGVIDLTQVRAVDLKSRNGVFIEAAPQFIVDQAIGRFVAIFDDE